MHPQAPQGVALAVFFQGCTDKCEFEFPEIIGIRQ